MPRLIGDFLPFYYQVLYILYDFKAKVNIQRVEKRQQRQQQGKVEEQIGNRFALKAYQHCAAYDKKQTGRFFHKTGTCAARMASCSISLSFFPSSRASEDKISRCSSTGGARAAISSGVVYMRPSR